MHCRRGRIISTHKMNNKAINMLEGKVRTTRGHLKKELMKLGLGFIRQVPAKFLLLPTLETEWMKRWERLTVIKGGYLLEKRNLLALTMLHPPIHNIVRQEGLDNLKKQGLTKGLGAAAKRIIYEWKKQGKPRPGPMQIGETLMIMENRMGPLILRTIIEKKKEAIPDNEGGKNAGNSMGGVDNPRIKTKS